MYWFGFRKYFHGKRSIESNSNLWSMSINNESSPWSPHPPSTQTTWAVLVILSWSVQGVSVPVQLQQKSTVDSSRRSCFWGSSECCLLDGCVPLSRVAVGRDQQLVRRVVSPPAQHHAGAEHAQHLEKTARVVGGQKKGRSVMAIRQL